MSFSILAFTFILGACSDKDSGQNHNGNIVNYNYNLDPVYTQIMPEYQRNFGNIVLSRQLSFKGIVVTASTHTWQSIYQKVTMMTKGCDTQFQNQYNPNVNQNYPHWPKSNYSCVNNMVNQNVLQQFSTTPVRFTNPNSPHNWSFYQVFDVMVSLNMQYYRDQVSGRYPDQNFNYPTRDNRHPNQWSKDYWWGYCGGCGQWGGYNHQPINTQPDWYRTGVRYDSRDFNFEYSRDYYGSYYSICFKDLYSHQGRKVYNDRARDPYDRPVYRDTRDNRSSGNNTVRNTVIGAFIGAIFGAVLSK